jgi:hypothetical protein
MKDNNNIKQEVIDYLSSLNIDELGDVLMEAGAFRNAQVCKENVENENNIQLYYEEYKGVDYCDVFIFPRNNDNLIW